MNFHFLIQVIDQYIDNALDDPDCTRGYLEVKLKSWLDVSFSGGIISESDYPYVKDYIKECIDSNFGK